jgi:hypothetical protein
MVERSSKHQKPHGWQHGATDVQGRRGESRQGGGKPWRRNEDEQWFCWSRGEGSDAGAGVDSSIANDGGAIFGNPRRGIRQGRELLLEAEMVASKKATLKHKRVPIFNRKTVDPPGRGSVSRNPGRPGTNLETGNGKVQGAVTSCWSRFAALARRRNQRRGSLGTTSRRRRRLVCRIGRRRERWSQDYDLSVRRRP